MACTHIGSHNITHMQTNALKCIECTLSSNHSNHYRTTALISLQARSAFVLMQRSWQPAPGWGFAKGFQGLHISWCLLFQQSSWLFLWNVLVHVRRLLKSIQVNHWKGHRPSEDIQKFRMLLCSFHANIPASSTCSTLYGCAKRPISPEAGCTSK